MNRQELLSLIQKFHQQTIDDLELAKLKMFVSLPEAQEVLESMEFPGLQAALITEAPAGMYESIQRRIGVPSLLRTGRKRKLWYATAAASVLVVMAFTYWQLTKSTNKAAQWVEVIVPKGEKKKIVLPDNSIVYLNAGSQLSYPDDYPGDTRLVRLKGEAFFEVAHDASHPFIVKTAHIDTRVLGTRFNVEAYEREGITRVALVEGKVETGDSSHKIILSPGNMMVHDHQTGRQLVQQTEGDMAAWIKGELVFNGVSLREALERISEAYVIKISVEPQLNNSYTITGHFKREEPAKILDLLLAIHGLHWKKAGNAYQVYQ